MAIAGSLAQRSFIAIAEDNEPLRYGICQILEESFEAAGYADGPALLEAVERRRPDLVLLDISLKGMNGLAVARRLRNTHPDLKIVFLTGYLDPAYISEAIRLGAQGYIVKKELLTQLLPVVRDIIGGHRCFPPI